MGLLRGEGPKAEARFFWTGDEGCKAQCPPVRGPGVPAPAPASTPATSAFPGEQRPGGGSPSLLYCFIKSNSSSQERPGRQPRHRGAGRSSSEHSREAGPPPPDLGDLGGVTPGSGRGLGPEVGCEWVCAGGGGLMQS